MHDLFISALRRCGSPQRQSHNFARSRGASFHETMEQCEKRRYVSFDLLATEVKEKRETRLKAAQSAAKCDDEK